LIPAERRENGEEEGQWWEGETLRNVTDYRHDGATRVNIPPAKIAAEGAIPRVQEAQYSYSPRRPPTLRFDQHGAPDKLFDLLEQARHRALNEEEAKLLADALQTHEPWLNGRGSARQNRSRWTPLL